MHKDVINSCTFTKKKQSEMFQVEGLKMMEISLSKYIVHIIYDLKLRHGRIVVALCPLIQVSSFMNSFYMCKVIYL